MPRPKALGEAMERTEARAMGELLQRRGLRHEADYLRRLKEEEGKMVTEIPKGGNLQGGCYSVVSRDWGFRE